MTQIPENPSTFNPRFSIFFLVQFKINTHLEHYDAAVIAQCLTWFPLERKENVLRMKTIQGRREKVAAYELLVELLRETGRLQELPTFVYNEFGKPELSGYPGLFFNISHCRNAVAVALNDAPVGIDVECRRRVARAVIERVCCETEIAAIDSAPDSVMEFIKIWTQKEALLKCIGTGIRENMQQILIENTDYQIFTNPLPDVDGFVSVCAPIVK